MRTARPKLSQVIDALEKVHGKPTRPLPKTPLDWILWENVAYLVDDERRAELFRLLAKTVGLRAEKLERAKPEALLAITSRGGMHPEARVERLKEIAEIAIEEGGGDLTQVLERPLPAARKALRRFPSIGAPGADKILLFCGASDQLALDSNGLRVLVRLGFGSDVPSYTAMYKSALAATLSEQPRGASAAQRAHQLLRTHGKLICRHKPDCDACLLASSCPSARSG